MTLNTFYLKVVKNVILYRLRRNCTTCLFEMQTIFTMNEYKT